VKSLPLRMATCDGAQVALQQSLILRPGNKQCIKNYEGGVNFRLSRGVIFRLALPSLSNPGKEGLAEGLPGSLLTRARRPGV